MLDILFAGPDDFHRTVDLFADAHGSRDHVGFEPAAEAAAEQMIVHGHLVERQTRRFCRVGLAARHHLGAGPYFAGVGGDVHRAVQRLHGRMRQERQLVFAVDPVALRQTLGDVADRFGDDAVFFARGAQVVPDIGRTDLGVRPFVPCHVQRVEALLGRPGVIADNRDQIVEHDDLSNAGNGLRGAVVDMARPCRRTPDTAPASQTSSPATWRRCHRRPCRRSCSAYRAA